MIVACNVKGLNNVGKCREIRVCLNKMKPKLVILLENKVRRNKNASIRNELGNNWMLAGNYSKHDNGRIWILWDDTKIKVTYLDCSAQYLHLRISNINGERVS